MSVYAVKWNNFHPRVFLSASADWTVKLWDHNTKTSLMSAPPTYSVCGPDRPPIPFADLTVHLFHLLT